MRVYQFTAFVAYLTLSIEGQAGWLSRGHSVTKHVHYQASHVDCNVHAFCCVYFASQPDAVRILAASRAGLCVLQVTQLGNSQVC